MKRNDWSTCDIRQTRTQNDGWGPYGIRCQDPTDYRGCGIYPSDDGGLH